MSEAPPEVTPILAKLRAIRERKDLSIRPCKYLRTKIKMADGSERDFKLRYYQIQMICHLLIIKRFIVGDDCGLGKTAEAISTIAYLAEKKQSLKTLVLTKKSAVLQWADEFNRFSVGIKTFVVTGTPAQRVKIYDAFDFYEDGPSVLIMGYRLAAQDFSRLQDYSFDVTVFDESTVFKSPTAQVHQVCRHIANQSDRVWGLTATLIKNNLVEGYGIYRVINSEVFSHSTVNAFIQDYCIVRMQSIGKGKQVPIVVGYKRSDVERFRQKIEPYYLGRPKHEVATELPPLTIRVIKCSMSSEQIVHYEKALQGMLEVSGEEKEVTKLTAVTYCQEIVDHPLLIGCDGPSDKLDELVDLLTDGELAGRKVIVFTRFERMVGIGIKALEKKGIKCVRITGAETKDTARKLAQDTFQDFKSDVKVIWITTAGNDAINLQSAEAMVFYDTPFSAGDFLQTLGRMIRIGSIHDRVLAFHLVCAGTIDARVMEIMEKKMDLLESVLGKRIKGDDMDDVIESQGDLNNVFDKLREDAKKGTLVY